jgi:hypothetical protein
VSGVLSHSKPHRIKASHRRRWKGTTGHSVYIMNNPLAGTDPTGYMSSICSIGSNENARGCGITEVNPSSPSASDGRKAGNGGKKENGAPGQKSTLAQKIDEYGKRINKYFNIDQDRVTSGKLNDRARMIAEGDLIGGSNGNNQTPEKQELLRNLHTSAVVAEISGNVAKDQATDPLNYAGPAFKLLAGIKILMVAVKLEKAEDLATAAPLGKYSSGPFNKLQGKVPGLDAHHAGQKAAMKRVVPDYDANTAPSILVPKEGHTIRGPNGIVSRNTNGLDNARDIVARDVREMRRVYPDVPNSALQKVIKLNKESYPDSFRK